jgi:hypothetical protein
VKETATPRHADQPTPRKGRVGPAITGFRRSRTSAVLAIGAVVLAGAVCLAMPFWGDQALFTVYARELTRGAVLYRDVFDVKQPGIFIFYALGGQLFGFTEVGIHLFELAYWVAFSAFCVAALRPYFATRRGSPLVPVSTVVVYYLYAELLDLTQIEILVAFPLLLAWWLIDRADPSTRDGLRRLAAAGLVAAVVVLMKHLYILIVFGFLIYWVLRIRRRDVALVGLWRGLAAFAIGLGTPLLVIGVYFAAYGQLGRIWWAYFEMAPGAQLGSLEFDYFLPGIRRFMIGHGPMIILAVIGTVRVLRDRSGPRFDLMIGMLSWLVTGALAFFVQGWPVYKWLLFTVPIGILAVLGVEALAEVAVGIRREVLFASLSVVGLLAISTLLVEPSPRVQTYLLGSILVGVVAGTAAVALVDGHATRPWISVAGLAIALSIGLSLIVPVDKIGTIIEHDFALTVQDREELRRSMHDAYRRADADIARFERTGPVPGSLHVFGDPVLLLRSGRPQGLPILGWGPEFYDRRAWMELSHDLRVTLPPYLVVDDRSEAVIEREQGSILRVIDARYDVIFRGASGTWYVRR